MDQARTDLLYIWTPAHSNYIYRLSQGTWLILDDERQMREVDAPVNKKDERIAHWLITAMKEDSNAV